MAAGSAPPAVPDSALFPGPIPGYLPAYQPHLISGPSGVGKTAFCAWLVQQIREGKPVFGHPTNPPPWMGLVITDRQQSDTLTWYERAGWPDIPCYSAVDAGEEKFDYFAQRYPKTALRTLQRIVDIDLKVPEGGVVILDPVAWVAGGELNRYDKVMPALGALSQWLCVRRITVIGVSHTGKQRADPKEQYARPQDKILGSMALLGGTGTQMALEGPDQVGEEGVYRFSWTPHLVEGETFELARTKEGLFTVTMQTGAGAPTVPHPEVLVLIPVLPATITRKELIQLVRRRRMVSIPTLDRLLEQYCSTKVALQTSRGVYCRHPLQ
jgi:hypothetical protein